MSRPRLFMEDPAGLAAVSLRLHGGPNCRPPISRMGNKQGYAEVILAALGLRSGQGAGAYLWVEADPDVAALLRCYPDAAMLRRVAEIIRSWADEEPRALWERLRAERKARQGAEGTARFVQLAGANRLIPGAFAADGRWVNAARDGGAHTDGGVSFGGEEFATNANANANACHTLAEYATIAASNRLINMAGPDLMNTGNGGTRFGGEFATPARDVADAFERIAGEVAAAAAAAAAARTMPQANARGATDGDFLPRIAPSGVVRYAPDAPAPGMDALADVASWIQQGVWSYRQGDLDSGGPVLPGERRQDTTATATARCARGRWPPVLVLPTIPTAAEVAEWLGTPGDLEGVVRYADPPYLGTTGYLHDYPRADVVRLARDYAAMGATVCISEAEPIADLTGEGWHAVEITEGRRGQKRTFSAQKREYLTMNREPQHRVATQAGLFG